MRIVPKILVVLLSVVVVGYGLLYGLSEYKLHNIVQPPPFEYSVKMDSLTIQKGQHIARTRGCFGCHGQQLQGRVFTDEWIWVDRAVAPNLPDYAKKHDASTLEAAIRHGIGKDGRALWSMPSYNWVHLSDEDLSALISYLKSAPVISSDLPSPNLGWKARWQIISGGDKHMAERVNEIPPLKFSYTDPQLIRGEYLALTTCTECHGYNLSGEINPDISTPGLKILKSYTEEDFRRLMKDGVALGGRENLPLMSMIAQDRFASFTEEELTDLYAYLNQFANETPDNVENN